MSREDRAAGWAVVAYAFVVAAVLLLALINGPPASGPAADCKCV